MPISLQSAFNALKQKVESEQTSKFEKHVYRRCEKALEFCKSYFKGERIHGDDFPFETIIDPRMRMLLSMKYPHQLSSKLKNAGYIRTKDSVIPPIEPYLLMDMGNSYVTVVNGVFKETAPKMRNQSEDVDWGGYWRFVPQAEILFEERAKTGVLTFLGDKFKSLDVTIGKPFSMKKKERSEDFINKLEEYEKELGLK